MDEVEFIYTNMFRLIADLDFALGQPARQALLHYSIIASRSWWVAEIIRNSSRRWGRSAI